jgi:1-acyl-sn-glycerol-3-phosphate acyltransferase
MNTHRQNETAVAETAAERSEPPLRHALAVARSAARWAMSGGYFFTVVPALVLLGTFVDPRKNDAPQRWLSRTVVRLAGAHVEVRRSPGFDPKRTCFLISNHVNLFDPFVLYSTVPQFFRGLELESHFRIPAYGWMMKRFGNVPVPDQPRPADLKQMWRMTRAAIESGVSLVVFAEGSRTINGRVGPFQDGVFRMAQQFGTPITPVSIVGAFDWNRKTSWMLRPARVVVHLHDTIETSGMGKKDLPELRDRVWKTVAGPVHAAMDVGTEVEPAAKGSRGSTS